MAVGLPQPDLVPLPLFCVIFFRHVHRSLAPLSVNLLQRMYLESIEFFGLPSWGWCLGQGWHVGVVLQGKGWVDFMLRPGLQSASGFVAGEG